MKTPPSAAGPLAPSELSALRVGPRSLPICPRVERSESRISKLLYMQVPPLELEPGEKLLADVFANLFRGWEGVGGKLYITDRRIRFESHRWNGQPGPSEILLREATAVRSFDNLGLIPNGVLVETDEGKSYRFVVWRRQRLIELIQMAMTKTPGTGEHDPVSHDLIPPGWGVWDRELDGNL
jgi:hypothetical protein